jgi:chitinase
MDVTDVDTCQFTHTQLAFATITPRSDVGISQSQDHIALFVTLKGVKRILSSGGWSFSTGQNTYHIFPQSVTDANRNTFIANIVKFVKATGINGVYFDWENPGAPDIPGIPAGSP